MRIDLYTKVVLTVIAIMLAVITLKPLISPETTASATTASAQGASFAGVQYSDGKFFDSRTGEIWTYGPDGSNHNPGMLRQKMRLTKLGQPLVIEYNFFNQ